MICCCARLLASGVHLQSLMARTSAIFLSGWIFVLDAVHSARELVTEQSLRVDNEVFPYCSSQPYAGAREASGSVPKRPIGSRMKRADRRYVTAVALVLKYLFVKDSHYSSIIGKAAES